MSQRNPLYRLLICLLFLFGGQQAFAFPQDSTLDLVGQQLKALLQEGFYQQRTEFTEEQLTAAVIAELQLPITEIRSQQDSLLLALVWHKIGVGFKNKLEDYQKAITYYRKALQLRQRILEPGERDLILGLRNIGNCYVALAQRGFLSHQDSAEWYLYQAIQQDRTHQLTGQTAVSLGDLYEQEGDFPKAVEQYELAIAHLDHDPYRQALAKSYLVAALTHSDRALDALPIALETHLYFQEMGDVWDNGHIALHLGWIYEQLGEPIASQQAYQEADRWYPEDDTINRQRLYANWGASLFYFNQPVAAIQQLKQGLALQPNRHQQSFLYHNLGEAYRANQEFEAARLAYQQAIQCFPPAETSAGISPRLIENYARLGQTYWEWHQQAALSTAHLMKADSLYQRADSLLQLIRTQPQSRQSKRLRAAQTKVWYENWLQVCVALYRSTQDRFWLERAFHSAEKSKSNQLREHLHHQQVRQAILGEERWQELQQLEAHIVQVISRKEKYADEPAFASAKSAVLESLQQLQISYRLLLSEIEQQYPNYSKALTDDHSWTLEDIQADLLAPDQQMVEYFEGQDSLFAFWVSQDRIEIRVVETSAEFEVQLYQLLDLMESHAEQLVLNTDEKGSLAQEFHQQMAPLSEWLLPTLPSPSQTKRLLIIADGSLEQFPFSALLTEPNLSPTSFRELPFLLRKTAISQAFSCGIQDLYRTNKVHPNTPFMGMAPIEFSKFSGPPVVLRPLHGSQVEMDSLSRRMAGSFHYFSDASRQTFFSEGSVAAILHLSTHGVVDSLYPEMSFLSLYDGPVYAYDLYHRQFQAQLVVNSLCEGNRGKVDPGEGVRSLTRAFAYTGAKSVLSTQWSLLDDYTTPFMDAFYSELLTGAAKDESLQRAQVKLLDSGLSHPLFWAPYVMYGDVHPLPADLRDELIPKPTRSWPWLILGMLLLMGGGRYWWKRSRDHSLQS